MSMFQVINRGRNLGEQHLDNQSWTIGYSLDQFPKKLPDEFFPFFENGELLV
jgi:hypothetical protein